MRLEARVLEGDEVVKHLVPLSARLAFKDEYGKGIDACLPRTVGGVTVQEGDDPDAWEPLAAYLTMTKKAGETRTFDEWCEAVESVGIWGAPDELDPSTGEATPAPTSSPDSSSTPDAGPTSSTSTTSFKKPSGANSTEAPDSGKGEAA